MPTYQNRQLYGALLALVEIGRAAKPQYHQDGTRSPALLDVPADGLGFKLALARNALMPVGEAVEAARKELQETHNVKDGTNLRTTEERQGFAERLEEYQAADDRLIRQEVEWAAPFKPIRSSVFGARAFSPEWLAPLIAVGIVAVDDDDEAPRDRKKQDRKKKEE
jgi:hypothetical protein